MDKHWIAQATSWLKTSRHSKVIFEEGELQTEATVRQYRIVASAAARTLARLNRYRRAALAKAAVFGTILPDTPAMPLFDAHFGGFFISGCHQ